MDAAGHEARLIASPAGTVFRDRLADGATGPEMCVIPAGRFLMGSSANEPGRSRHEGLRRETQIERPFALGRYAVTFDEYDAFCAATRRPLPNDADWGRVGRPAINVSWLDAAAYCEWLSEKSGAKYRLPNEAEWEYACRAGTTTRYWWGSEITPAQANYMRRPGDPEDDAFEPAFLGSRVVHLYDGNPWGLFQMHGNVWEWCEDPWADQHGEASPARTAWAGPNATLRVLRGGAWCFPARGARSAYRNANPQGARSKNVGFRVARSLSV